MSRKEYIQGYMLVCFRERDKDVNRRRWSEKRGVLVLRMRDVNSGPGEYVFGIVKGS